MRELKRTYCRRLFWASFGMILSLRIATYRLLNSVMGQHYQAPTGGSLTTAGLTRRLVVSRAVPLIT
eukprot:XP_001697769.1 predicted protein [Chlamydomonas reinhardtii]